MARGLKLNDLKKHRFQHENHNNEISKVYNIESMHSYRGLAFSNELKSIRQVEIEKPCRQTILKNANFHIKQLPQLRN